MSVMSGELLELVAERDRVDARLTAAVAGFDALKAIPDEPVSPPSRMFLSNALDGRGALNGDLDADDQLVVSVALRVATVADLPEEPKRTPAEQRADALVAISQFFLDNQHT